MSKAVLGLDLSLTATGVALPDGSTRLIKLGSCCNRGMKRLASIRRQVLGMVQESGAELVSVEGYSFGSRDSHAHALGELGGVIRLALSEAGVPYIDVPPSSLKKYATGKGNATKELVLVHAVRRLEYPGSDNNEADALWLRALGLDFLGSPVVEMPQLNRTALEKIDLIEPIGG